MHTPSLLLAVASAACLWSTAGPAVAQWDRQAPVPHPTAHQPTALRFAGSRAFVTGMNNFPFGEHVLGSTDAGATWRKLFDAPVTTVHFADAMHGWMVGDAAAFRTIDGGASWQPMASFPATSYQRLGARGASFVWAMNTPWASGYPVMISEDGGASWRAAQVGNDEIRIADFAAAPTGVGANPQGLWRTTDAGRTWALVHAVTGIQDVRMLDPNTAVAIRDAGMILDGEMLHSADGGRTWSVVWRQPGLGLGDQFEPIDALRVLARAGIAVARSTDGGRTWAAVNVGNLHDASPSAIVHVGQGRVFVSSVLGEIFRSLDAGASWQQVFAGYAGPFNDFAFADASVGCAAGVYGALLRTTDGGATWGFVSSGLSIANLDLAMWDRRRGIAIAENGFKLLQDDGATWIPQPYTSGMQQSDVAVCILPGGHAVTVGRNQVHVSTDHGRTWTPRTPVLGGAADVTFLDASLGWVVGDSLRVSHTNDGGQSWTVQHHLPSRHVLASIDMLDAQHGWTSGSGGVILKTTDGRTWQPVALPISHPGATQGLRLDFVTPEAGWVIGEYGLIATTADGGGSWTSRSLPGFDEQLTAVHAVSASEAYVAAYHSMNLTDRLLHSTDGGRTWRTLWNGDDAITHIERSPADELWLCGTRGMIWHREPGGAFAVFAAGCPGSAGVPLLAAPLPPRLGATFRVDATRLPAGATSAVLLLGGSSDAWSGVTLPLDLAFLAMPGCALRVSIDAASSAAAAAGQSSWGLAVPTTASLLARPIHLQVLVGDPAANPAGLIVSDAARAWIGR